MEYMRIIRDVSDEEAFDVYNMAHKDYKLNTKDRLMLEVKT